MAGQPVVVLGYPAGLEAILAKADARGRARDPGERHRAEPRSPRRSARKGLIRPSTTQGHIGDVTRTDIVFDAPTTQGGSGGPVFNRDGRSSPSSTRCSPSSRATPSGCPSATRWSCSSRRARETRAALRLAEPGPRRDLVLALLLFLVAAAFRLPGLGFPTEEYFDEVYHAKTARQYLAGEQPIEWVHPPRPSC